MQTTGIQWTDATVNFWQGCKQVSPGCKFCYMYREKEGYNQDPYSVKQVSDKYIKKTVLRNVEKRRQERLAGGSTEPMKIFTCSWSDFFIKEADEWRDWAWQIIREHPELQWQILTKRPERILECLPPDWGEGYDNVWLGVSIETQKFLHRAKTLSQIPAKIRFISAEPLIGEIDFLQEKEVMNKMDWIIGGGESGNDYGKHGYRECKVEWIERIINDLKDTKVKIFVKQLGTYIAKEMYLEHSHGGNWDEWVGTLEHLRIREFPELEKGEQLQLIKQEEIPLNQVLNGRQ